MKRRTLVLAAPALAAPALALAPARVRAQGSLHRFKFNLGWKVEATAAGFLLAQQRGYYKDAGLDVAIDTGNGSSAAISLVASGAYDCASADLATMIEFGVANPTAGLKAVAIMYDLNPNAILVRKDGPIRKPADLAGKSILAWERGRQKSWPAPRRVRARDEASARPCGMPTQRAGNDGSGPRVCQPRPWPEGLGLQGGGCGVAKLARVPDPCVALRLASAPLQAQRRP